jgi:hypothetical protein
MSNYRAVATQEGRRARDDASKTVRLAVLTMAALCVTGTMMLGSQAGSVAPPVMTEATNVSAEMVQLAADDLSYRGPAPVPSCGPQPWLASSFNLAAESPDLVGLECQCRPVGPAQLAPGDRSPGQGRPGQVGPGPVATLTAADAAAGKLMMVND